MPKSRYENIESVSDGRKRRLLQNGKIFFYDDNEVVIEGIDGSCSEWDSLVVVAPNEDGVQEKDFSIRLSILENDVAHIKNDLATIKEDTKLILDLLMNKQVHTNNEPQVYTPPISLPVKSREALIEVDDLLGRDPAFKEYLENLMGEMQAKDLGKFLRKNLIKIISNPVAAEYSWHGKGETKHALNELKNLITVLAGAARKKEIYEDTMFVREISNWLAQSKKRKGDIVTLIG